MQNMQTKGFQTKGFQTGEERITSCLKSSLTQHFIFLHMFAFGLAIRLLVHCTVVETDGEEDELSLQVSQPTDSQIIHENWRGFIHK